MEVKQLTNENFKEFTSQDETVLVDFWAVWCGPCKMLAPALENLAASNFIQVGKVNVDDEELISSAFGIESIPTIMLFKSGKLVAKAVGYQPEQALKNWINQNK